MECCRGDEEIHLLPRSPCWLSSKTLLVFIRRKCIVFNLVGTVSTLPASLRAVLPLPFSARLLYGFWRLRCPPFATTVDETSCCCPLQV